jgi:hypothetical protein
VPFGRAGARDVDLVEDLGADEEPDRTNTIAGVIGDPDSRFETAATAISASATVVSDQSIQIRSTSVDPPARSLIEGGPWADVHSAPVCSR